MTTPEPQPKRRHTTLVGTDRSARLLGMVVTNGLMGLCLASIYLVLLLSLPILGFSRSLIQTLATVAVAVMVIPLRQRLVTFSNYLIRRKWQDSQELLREFAEELSRTIDPEAIHALLVGDLPGRLRLQGAILWMLEPPEDRVFTALGSPPDQPGSQLLAVGASASHVDQVTTFLLVDPHDPAAWAEPFLAHEIYLLFPLRISERLIGIYGCGLPSGRRIYPAHVVSLLQLLMPTIAGALENARAYTVIARLNQQLFALDKLKDEFIESVGHELRTPLTSLSLATQLMSGNPELIHDLAGILSHNVNHLQSLISRILSLNTTGTPGESQIGEVDLFSLLSETLAVFQPAATARGIFFRIIVQQGLAAWAETDRLRRAIHEIVDNAVRYGGEGAVEVRANLNDGLAVISVSDQGTGIPEDERPMLFSSFYRGRHTRAMAMTPGFGLGLSIARREIEANGGRVWLEQSGPKGTTVAIAIPAAFKAGPVKEREVGR